MMNLSAFTSSHHRVCLVPGCQLGKDHTGPKKPGPFPPSTSDVQRSTPGAQGLTLNTQRQAHGQWSTANCLPSTSAYRIASCTPARLHVYALVNQNNHNNGESFTLATPSYQPSHPALQADAMPIHEKAPCETKLTYLPSHFLTLQKRLLEAFNDVLYTLSSLYSPSIYNYQLSINSLDVEAFTNLARTQQKWVEKEKMTIFSLFNHKNKKAWIGRKVNRRFLAIALRKSGIDFLNDLWHALHSHLACLPSSAWVGQNVRVSVYSPVVFCCSVFASSKEVSL